jgi:large subunit ribosomal protein L28e
MDIIHLTFSGLANKKTVSIAPGSDLTVYLATTKTKKTSKPKDSINRCLLKKDVRRMAKVVENQVRLSYIQQHSKNNMISIISNNVEWKS